uniref:Caspase family p20 domain-containing protein n=1 Tax=Meloidogyne incognita TaxID=6306 RepID=A0A914MH97_MELIC
MLPIKSLYVQTNFISPITFIKYPVLSLKTYDQIYPNFSTPRGLAIIINNYKFINKQNREGTQVDELSLCNLFKQLGYKIICERDLTAQVILKINTRCVSPFSFLP